MGEELSLRELVEIVYRGRKLITGVVTIFIIIASVYSIFMVSPIYQAKTVLSVNQNLRTGSNAVGLEGLVNDLTEMPQINAQSYAAQAKTSIVIQGTMNRLGIDSQTIPVSVFTNKIDITNIKGTDLLEITAKDKDPSVAAKIANALSEELVGFISITSKSRIEKTLGFLKSQVKEEQTKVDKNVDGMKELLKQSPGVAQLENDLAANLELLSSLRIDIAEYEIKASGLRAAIATNEKELAAIPDKVQLKKSLFDDPIMLQAQVENNNLEISSASKLDLVTEEINPTYIVLREELNLNKNKLAKYEQQKESVERLINITVQRIENIQIELAEKKTRYIQMQAELDSSIRNYDLFKNKYAETMISQSVEAGEAVMIIVSPADEPLLPIGPSKRVYVMMAAISGFILGVLVVVLKYYITNVKPGRMNA